MKSQFSFLLTSTRVSFSGQQTVSLVQKELALWPLVPMGACVWGTAHLKLSLVNGPSEAVAAENTKLFIKANRLHFRWAPFK